MADLYFDSFTGSGLLSTHTSDSGHTYGSAGGSATPDMLTLANGQVGTFAPNCYGGGKVALAVPVSVIAEFDAVVGVFTVNGYMQLALCFDNSFPSFQIDNGTFYFGFGGSGNPTTFIPFNNTAGTHKVRFEATPTSQEWFLDGVSVNKTQGTVQSVAGAGFGFYIDNTSDNNNNEFRLDTLRLYQGTPPPPPAPTGPFWTQYTKTSEGVK